MRDKPYENITTYSTIGLCEYPMMLNGKVYEVRLEIIMSAINMQTRSEYPCDAGILRHTNTETIVGSTPTIFVLRKDATVSHFIGCEMQIGMRLLIRWMVARRPGVLTATGNRSKQGDLDDKRICRSGVNRWRETLGCCRRRKSDLPDALRHHISFTVDDRQFVSFVRMQVPCSTTTCTGK